MSKVWILFYSDFDTHDVVSVHATEYSAVAALDKICAKYADQPLIARSARSDYQIDEVEVLP